jgi:hypothetical protein
MFMTAPLIFLFTFSTRLSQAPFTDGKIITVVFDVKKKYFPQLFQINFFLFLQVKIAGKIVFSNPAHIHDDATRRVNLAI